MSIHGAAIIGVGGAGGDFVQVFSGVEHVELRAICDLNEELLHKKKEEAGIADAFIDYHGLCDREDIDIVAVCTPDHLHTEPAIAMMESGKHVIIEKPLATTFEGLERTVETARRTGRKVAHGTQLRYGNYAQECKRIVAAGEIGEIYYGEVDEGGYAIGLFTDNWRGEPGINYNPMAGGGVHLLDILLWLIDDEVEEVVGYGNRKCLTETGLDTYDFIVSLMKFRGGAAAKAITHFGSSRAPERQGVEVCGTEGSCLLTRNSAKIGRGKKPEEFESIEVDPAPYPNLREILVADLIDAIEKDSQPLTNIDQAARTAAVCIASFDSAMSGKPVRLA